MFHISAVHASGSYFTDKIIYKQTTFDANCFINLNQKAVNIFSWCFEYPV